MKFDGKKLAQKIEDEVLVKVASLTKKPKIVSFLVPSASSGQADPASVLYTRLKKEAAERVGVGFEIVQCEESELKSKIVEKAGQEEVTGLMVQLPLLRQGSGGQALPVSEVEVGAILSLIPKEKDVDGLRYPESKVVPPVSLAVMRILDEIAADLGGDFWGKRFAVVGARGFVGRAVMDQLVSRGVVVAAVGRESTREKVSGAEVVISCVGKAGLINEEMVMQDSILVDVGSPRGDFTQGAYRKAKISVEVPGGVGPVTIACLMETACELRGFSSKSSLE